MQHRRMQTFLFLLSSEHLNCFKREISFPLCSFPFGEEKQLPTRNPPGLTKLFIAMYFYHCHKGNFAHPLLSRAAWFQLRQPLVGFISHEPKPCGDKRKKKKTNRHQTPGKANLKEICLKPNKMDF